MASFMDGFLKGYGFMENVKTADANRAWDKKLRARQETVWDREDVTLLADQSERELQAITQGRTAGELKSDPAAKQQLIGWYNKWGDPNRPMGTGKVADLEVIDGDRIVPIIDIYDPKTKQRISRGPATVNGTSDPNDKVDSHTIDDLFQDINRVRAGYAGHSPNVAASMKAERTAADYRGGMDALFEGPQGEAVAPPPTRRAGMSAPSTPSAPYQAPAPSPAPEAPSAQPVATQQKALPLQGEIDALNAQIGELKAKPVPASIGGRNNANAGKRHTAKIAELEAQRDALSDPAALRARLEQLPKYGFEADRLRAKLEPQLAALEAPAAEQPAAAAPVPAPAPQILKRTEKAVASAEAPSRAELPAAQQTVSSIKPGRKFTDDQRQALVKLHLANPQAFPLETLDRVLRTGRMSKPDIQFINTTFGAMAVDRDTMQVVGNFSDPGAIAKFQADLAKTAAEIADKRATRQEKTNEANTKGIDRLVDMVFPDDKKQASQRTALARNLGVTMSTLGMNLGEPDSQTVLLDATMSYQKYLKDNDGWFGFGADDREFKSFTPFLVAARLNRAPEDVIQGMIDPVQRKLERATGSAVTLSDHEQTLIAKRIDELEANMPREQAIEAVVRMITDKIQQVK